MKSWINNKTILVLLAAVLISCSGGVPSPWRIQIINKSTEELGDFHVVFKDYRSQGGIIAPNKLSGETVYNVSPQSKFIIEWTDASGIARKKQIYKPIPPNFSEGLLSVVYLGSNKFEVRYVPEYKLPKLHLP